MREDGISAKDRVSFRRAEFQQNLEVTKVVGRVKQEVLVVVLFGEAQSNLPFEDHIHLLDYLTSLQDALVSDKNTAAQARYKVT